MMTCSLIWRASINDVGLVSRLESGLPVSFGRVGFVDLPSFNRFDLAFLLSFIAMASLTPIMVQGTPAQSAHAEAIASNFSELAKERPARSIKG